MFGYVLPCKMELKMKDYELFRSYYCGLCVSIRSNFGQIPRTVLNYDMTFLAILLDSFNEERRTFVQNRCFVHPFKKRTKILNNDALDFAAYCNVILAYFKLIDDVHDDNSLKAKLFSKFLAQYIKKIPDDFKPLTEDIKENLDVLSNIEKENTSRNIDEISHPFAHLTGLIVSYYLKDKNLGENLYWLGYNLGKWIYIIDARDDLKEDMEKGKYNPLNTAFNEDNYTYDVLIEKINPRIEELLLSCGFNCVKNLKQLPLKRNIDLLENILHLGLIERMNVIFEKK